MHPHINELLVARSSLISHTGQVRVSLLAVLPYHTAVIVRVFPKEAFRVVIAINVDFSKGIMGSRLFTAFMDARLQPRQQQLQPGREFCFWGSADQISCKQNKIQDQN